MSLDTTAQQIEDALIPRAMRDIAAGIILIISNAIPLVGVLWGGWNLLTVMLLYWAENVVVGIYNIARMVTILGWGDQRNFGCSQIFLIPFFTLHYGMFCFIHGVMLAWFLGPHLDHGSSGMLNNALTLTVNLIVQHPAATFTFALLSLFVQHGISFITPFLMKGEYRQAKCSDLGSQPYGRIILLHVTLLAGAVLMVLTGAKAAILALLVFIKLIIDLLIFLRDPRKAIV